MIDFTQKNPIPLRQRDGQLVLLLSQHFVALVHVWTMEANEDSCTIDITQRQLFHGFSLLEGKGKKPTESDYYSTINRLLPSTCKILTWQSTQLNNQIRTYKRKKQLKRYSLQDVIDSSTNEVVLSTR